MSEKLEVVGNWSQATVNTQQERAREKQRQKEATKAKGKAKPKHGLPQRTVPTVQEIGFSAELRGAAIGPITIPAGNGSPTLTGGWPKIATVDRYQRGAITVPEGWTPFILRVPVLFDSVVTVEEQPDVERQIETLEEMAGRPKGAVIPGEPPQVEVFSGDTHGHRTNLIPRKLQEDSGLLWYITNIDFDPNALRDEAGDRIRQAATVELTEILLGPSGVKAELANQHKIAASRPASFKTTSNINTIKRVAHALASTFHNKHLAMRWDVLLAANRSVTTNAERHLRPHTKIKIPPDFWVKVAR